MEWGDPEHRPLILLHGLRDCARSWDKFANSIQNDYRVIALDSRGHGDSGWCGSGEYSFDNYVTDIKAIVSELKLREILLIGHSAGGRYAWRYAEEHPEVVKALIVVDIDPDPVNDQTNRDFEVYHKEPIIWDSLEAVKNKLKARQPLADGVDLNHQALHLTRSRKVQSRIWRSDRRVMDEYERPDLWDSWRRISTPTLILRGRQSTLLNHETAVRMRECHPKDMVKLVELDGGGHWFYQDFPGAFETVVRWFLSSFVGD